MDKIQSSKRQTLQTDFIIPNHSMQHPEYKKPLQFRTVHSFIPPTPNLEEIKRTHMKIKAQKAPQNQIKIMTPRSTRNLHSEAEKKKTFRNLSLVLDSGTEHNTNQTDKLKYPTQELKQHAQNISNHPVFSQEISYEGKQNIPVGQFNMNMKKKSKQNINIEFKQVKSTKNKRFSQQILPKEPINQKNTIKHNNSQARHQLQKVSIPKHSQKPVYANEFQSATYHNHYKASTLASFNEALSDFLDYVTQVESHLQKQFTINQQRLSESMKQINQQYALISQRVNLMHKTVIKQSTDCLVKMKSQHNASMKQLIDMRKSITRYQADISTHYDDIVKELEFSCFQDIMAKYQTKLEYFDQQILWIHEKKYQQPQILQLWQRFVHLIEKMGVDGCMEQFQGDLSKRESRFRDRQQFLSSDEQLSSRGVN